MGYSISIGHATVDEQPADEYDGELIARYRVRGERHDCAPHDGSPTDFTNGRWPSYSGWSDFAESTGLSALFFSKERDLMREHPGCFRLRQEHLDEILAVKNVPEEQRGRYEWLCYWVKWALENCELPAIENS